MTALIWMLSWLPLVVPAMSKLPKPVNVSLTLLNFGYILKWEPGPGTPAGVHYSVTYNTERGHAWKVVAGCERVQNPLLCNLTVAFSDLKMIYLTSVKAQLGKQASEEVFDQYNHIGFKPILHLSLPLLSVAASGRELCVDLHPPLERLREYYSNLSYTLQMSSSSGDEPQEIEIQSLKRQILENVAPGRRYCVAVRFDDKLEDLYSNFSQPECAVTLTSFSTDPLIFGVLCLLVIMGMGCLIMAIWTGFICLRRRPLPSVLMSIHHMDEVRVNDLCIISSLLNVEPTAPSAGKKRSSRSSSDDSDEESEIESTTGSTGGAYAQCAGANPLSSSSSSTSLSGSKLPPAFSSSQPPDSQHDAQISTESPSRGGLKLRTDCGGRTKEEKVEGAQDVNLLTLTFGRVEKEKNEQEEEKSNLDVQEVEFRQTLIMEDATETVHEEEEEEEEDDDDDELSGYIGRPGV